MIDVLMSVRNGERFVDKSVRSILNQTTADFIFYIVDDASKDATWEILNSFKDARMKLFRNKQKKGLTENLNFLLKRGSNKYVARQDADDVSCKKRFERQRYFLQKNNLDLVGSYANLIDNDGNIVGGRKYAGKNLKNDLIKYNMFIHSSWFGRRRMFDELKGYDKNYIYAQDYDFLLRAASKFRLGICPEKLIDLRWDDDSISLKHLKEQQKFALRARTDAIARGDYARRSYITLLKPWLSYLLPARINKYLYRWMQS